MLRDLGKEVVAVAGELLLADADTSRNSSGVRGSLTHMSRSAASENTM